VTVAGKAPRDALLEFGPRRTDRPADGATVETGVMPKEAQISGQPQVAALKIASSERPASVWRVGTLALHPFLFAAASVFRFYAANLRESYLSDAVTALAAALAAALVLFLAFGAAFRSLGAKAAILASAAVVTGLFYVEIVDAVNWYAGVSLSSVAAMPIMLAALAMVSIAVAWPRIDFTPANAVLNGIAIMIFVVPAWQVASHQWKAGGASIRSVLDEAAHAAEASPAARLAATKNTPDIYYFIFDRYASQSVLADYYGFDNSDLIGFLEDKGFYVASNSRANYLKTAHSLASTFHMDYLDFLAEDPRSRIGDWHPIYDKLRDHRVGRFLKSHGYNFIQIGSWWGPTQYNTHADENHTFGLSDFNFWYLRKTIAAPTLKAVAPDSSYARLLQWNNSQCQRVPRQIKKVKEIGTRSEMTFVFAHILVPHDPYVFSADGRCLSDEMEQRTEQEGYIEQVRYANALIKDFVSSLLATDGPKPIIIIQADEGPFPARYLDDSRSWRDATVDELKAKMGILNAFYFPDGDYRDLDPQITSVNTFRILFDKYFGTKFGRLPDRIFAFPDISKIYDFYDITDVLRDDAE
jgi:hypothetical protein